MATLKQRDMTMARMRVFTAKMSPIELDSTSKILMDILSNIQAETGQEFSLCGGFVRNSLLGLPYNDFDICTPNSWMFRDIMQKMGILEMAEQEYDDNGTRLHDKFRDPYNLSGKTYPVHWVPTNDYNGYTPDTFDFSVNEFSLKSDGLLHAPTYAWRHFNKKILRANPNIGITTNMIMRAIRFAAVTGFTLDQQSIDRMKERFQKAPLDSFRVYCGVKKMLEDGVGNESYALMQKLGFRDIDDFDNIMELYEHASDEVKSGNYHRDHGADYHGFDDIHPEDLMHDEEHGDFHNDAPF